jgi:hypothetical protein
MDEKKDEKRNKKGQFEKGYGGGPGRGYKKESPVELDGELLDMIEQVVITGLGARDLKDRLKAAGIGIRVQGMKETDDTPTTADPFVFEFLSLLSDLSERHLNATGKSLSPIEIIKRMQDTCINCDLLKTCDFDRKEVEPTDTTEGMD